MKTTAIPVSLVVAGMVLIVFGSGPAPAATINAASASLNDVTSAVALASNGDTVIVPAGTADWTSALIITKGITLQGATTITGTAENPAMTDNTIIQDDISRSITWPSMIRAQLSPGQVFRMTGITFRYGKTTVVANGNGALRLEGSPTSARIDHCHFDQLYQGNTMRINDTVTGVIDHCVFDMATVSGALAIEIINGGGNYGDEAWAAPTNFGGSNFWFIEDNTFNNLHTTNHITGNLDAYCGGRYVARYNYFHNCAPNTHGTESGHRLRSCRAAEIYNNTIVFDPSFPGVGGQIRGGCCLLFNNTYTGNINKGMVVQSYRSSDIFVPWGGATGINGWDVNDATVYDSGTQTGPTSTGTLTDANKNWTSNQWSLSTGYTIYNTTTGLMGQILSNTATTATYAVTGISGVPPLVMRTGDHYNIYRVLVVLDQPGRGQGDLIDDSVHYNGVPINKTTGTVAWPHQALEPIYSWNNTLNGSNVNILSPYEPGTLKENRDFYNNTPMPGYTPYSYPHPLVSGSAGKPAPPTNLRIQP